MLAQRAIGLHAGAFGRPCDPYTDRVYGHRDSLKHGRGGKVQAIVKKDGMIKGIIGYRVLDHKKVGPILMQLESCAMQYPGFVDAEFLISAEDQSIGVMISTWETMENWRTWVESKGTIALLQRARIVVTGTPRITAYKTMPIVEWR